MTEGIVTAYLKTREGKPLREITVPRYRAAEFLLFGQRVFKIESVEPRQYLEVDVWIDPMPTVFRYPPYKSPVVYDPRFGDNKLCECGHEYVRHFDPYENMDPVGCKYCAGTCLVFKEKKHEQSTITRF